jgi:hypothetical protein
MVVSFLCAFAYIESLKAKKDSKKCKPCYHSLRSSGKPQAKGVPNLPIGVDYIESPKDKKDSEKCKCTRI